MNKKLFAMLAIAGLLFAASCTKDDVDEPTLTVTPEETISFTKEASEKVVTITTNQAKWSAMASTEWIELAPSGNALTIKTKENTKDAERKAQIMIVAGAANKILEVVQSASDIIVSILPDKTETDQWGGQFTFEVNANTTNWTATSNAEWVKINPKQTRGLLEIDVAENKDRTSRTAKITLSRGQKTITELVITQKGIIYFVLPNLEINKATIREIQEFEFKRKSILLKQPDPYNKSLWDFITPSPAFDIIRYDIPGNLYLRSVVYPSASKPDILVQERAAFDAFMKENGFAQNKDDKNKYFNAEKRTEAFVSDKAEGGNTAYVKFTYVPQQDKAYKTFSTLPYGLTEFGIADEAAIKKYESQNNGTYNAELSNRFMTAYFDVSTPPHIARLYYMTSQAPYKMRQTLQLFNQLSLALFEYRGDFYPTQEFADLMAKEGFTFVEYNTSKKLNYFYNSNKKLMLFVGAFANKLINGGETMLQLNIYQPDMP